LQFSRINRGKGIAESKAAVEIAAAGYGGQLQVAFDGGVNIPEPLLRQRRSSGENRPQSRQVAAMSRTRSTFFQSRQIAGAGSEYGYPLLFRHSPERQGIGIKGASLVQHDGCPHSQGTDQPVPHHPAAGGKIDNGVIAFQVGMQHQFLQVLQENARRSLHHALGRSGGAGGIHDVERMIWRKLGEVEACRMVVSACEIIVEHSLGNRCDGGLWIEIRDHHQAADGRNRRRYGLDPLQGVKTVTVVVIAVGAKKHLRLYLAKAFQHSPDAEIGRTGGPDCAQAGAGQHGHHGFGHIGHEARHAITGNDSGFCQGLGKPGYPFIQFSEADPLGITVFTPEDDRCSLVAITEQVFCKVEPAAAKPTCAGHFRRIIHHLTIPGGGDHAAELPHGFPEVGNMGYGPLVKPVEILKIHALIVIEHCHETGQVGLPDSLRRWRPDRLFHDETFFPRLTAAGWAGRAKQMKLALPLR